MNGKGRLISIVVACALALAIFLPARAQDGGQGPRKREVELVFDKSYEISIGNGGVYLDNSRHIGTLVVKANEPLNRGWHQFTQRILDIRVYNEDGREFDSVYGLIRVYFNLDSFQYVKWKDETANMSIWTFDELNGGWSKCVTHFEGPKLDYPKGRLYCIVNQFGLYGVAWTKPTLKMKLEKESSS